MPVDVVVPDNPVVLFGGVRTAEGRLPVIGKTKDAAVKIDGQAALDRAVELTQKAAEDPLGAGFGLSARDWALVSIASSLVEIAKRPR